MKNQELFEKAKVRRGSKAKVVLLFLVVSGFEIFFCFWVVLK